MGGSIDGHILLVSLDDIVCWPHRLYAFLLCCIDMILACFVLEHGRKVVWKGCYKKGFVE